MSIAIIDNGGANMNSLLYALQRLDYAPTLTTDAQTIADASHVILPGVGHAKDSMDRLRSSGLDHVVKELTQPVLGICLGMQILFAHSEEGPTDCLNLLDGKVFAMTGSIERPAPHMGWNQIHIQQPHPILEGIEASTYFYFVHGFTAALSAHTIAATDYGYTFASIAAHRNFVGVQFHPERSGAAGARILANFVNMT